MATVLGGLTDPCIDVRADGQPVGTGDTGLAEHVGSPGHAARVLFDVGGEQDRFVRGALGDPPHPRRLVAVEHRHVLAQCDLARRLVQWGQVEVGGPPLGIVDFEARDREIRPQLHQGQGLPLRGVDAFRRPGDGVGPAQVGGRVRPAVRSDEVHELACRQVGGEPGFGLGVYGRPSRL